MAEASDDRGTAHLRVVTVQAGMCWFDSNRTHFLTRQPTENQTKWFCFMKIPEIITELSGERDEINKRNSK